jgi:pyruvate dehydrogenase E1 component
MYQNDENVIYYITLQNEPYAHPPMPEGAAPGILKGMYKLQPAPVKDGKRSKVHLLGSAVILRECLRAQQILADKYGVAADVWSVTSYKELRRDALACERWNRLHPTAAPRKSYLEATLENEPGVYVAASDYMKATSEMISRWVPGGLMPLGTDGFGRSDDRNVLRRHFEVDAENVVIASLTQLLRKKEVSADLVAKAIKELGVDPDKADPVEA